MRCNFCGSPNFRISEYATLNGAFADVARLFSEDKVAVRCRDCRRFVVENDEIVGFARHLVHHVVKPEVQPMHVFNVQEPMAVRNDAGGLIDGFILSRTFRLWEKCHWPREITQYQAIGLTSFKWRRLWKRFIDPSQDLWVFHSGRSRVQ